MKRHPALEPFSRDHNTALILARRLTLASVEDAESRLKAARSFTDRWKSELKDHFDEEERLLGPLASAECFERLKREHGEIEEHANALSAGDLTPVRLNRCGEALDAHIRWEERSFFPEIERTATEAQLVDLARQTDDLEARRWVDDPRREELVKRRKARLDILK